MITLWDAAFYNQYYNKKKCIITNFLHRYIFTADLPIVDYYSNDLLPWRCLYREEKHQTLE